MSLGWSRRAPVDTLVGTETEIDFTIPLAELPRVSHELISREGDTLSVRDLVDEEIMLAMPHVARHAEDSECAGRELSLPGQESETAEEAAAAQVQKPFAQLGELLKRK